MHTAPRFPALPASAASITVRPIREGEAPLLRAMFDGLSGLSRVRRFHAGVVSLPVAWIDRLAHPDPRTEAVLLAVAVENGREVAVGEARHAVDADPFGDHELAIAVADAWQGRGVGDALMHGLEADARRRGVRRLHGDLLHDNVPMLRLLRRRGWTVARHPGDPRLARAAFDLAAGAWPLPLAASTRSTPYLQRESTP